MPDDELNERNTHALVRGGDAQPIVDAELVEPEPERIDLPPSWSAERASNAVRRTYTISDF